MSRADDNIADKKRTARIVLAKSQKQTANKKKHKVGENITNKNKLNAAYKRYHDKTYKRYTLMLRLKEHSDVIEQIENGKKNGTTPTQTIVETFRKK